MSETIDVRTVEPMQAVAIRPEHAVAQAGLFGTDDPAAVIGKARVVAQALKDVIVKQGLVSKVGGKDYPRCEAWTLLGTMLGVFPVLAWSRPVSDGWEARVEAKTKDGATIGAAEAQCLRTERNWASRDDFALRSMAQTRATSKCLRMPLGFVMSLSGFEVTPAEEMVSDHPQNGHRTPAAPQPPRPTPKSPPSAQSAPKASESAKTATPVKFPTEAYREQMISSLKARPGEPNRDNVTEYFRKLSDPAQLMPNEELEALPLRFVPATKEQMWALHGRITAFSDGERAEPAFPPHPEPGPAKASPAPAQAELPAGAPGVVGGDDPDPDEEDWRNVIVVVPKKGQKRDAYLKNPDTIGSLFDQRHGEDEESQAARQRLWGLVHNYEPKPWVGKDGQKRPPSKADVLFRQALDQFMAYFEKHNPGEKL